MSGEGTVGDALEALGAKVERILCGVCGREIFLPRLLSTTDAVCLACIAWRRRELEANREVH